MKLLIKILPVRVRPKLNKALVRKRSHCVGSTHKLAKGAKTHLLVLFLHGYQHGNNRTCAALKTSRFQQP